MSDRNTAGFFSVERGAGRPSGGSSASLPGLGRYKSFRYQAESWTTPRRIVAKVEHHVRELFPRVGFIVTNLPLSNRAVVRFDNKRRTAEPWIKAGKQAAHWPGERGPLATERAGLQPRKPLAAAGAAEADRHLVADQSPAAPRQDWRAVGETRALLLAAAGGESPDSAPVRGDAPADLGATGPGRLTRGKCKDAGLAKRGHK